MWNWNYRRIIILCRRPCSNSCNASPNSNNIDNSNYPNDNIPRNRENPDIARLIRYLSTNVGALLARRPVTRAIGLTVVNAGNIIADVASNEERANYWIDQWNFYKANGRFRGGAQGSGPFERGTNPFEPASGQGPTSSGSLLLSKPGNTSTSNFTSNLIGDGSVDFSFIKDFFTPVDHNIPLDTLISVHFP